MARKTDRRRLRTQNALREALVGLLRHKDYDEITVQEIIDEANVGRSTFYAHCAGKDQLLRLCLELLRTELTAAQDIQKAKNGKPALTFSLPVLTHIREHGDLYPSLGHGRGRELFMNELKVVVAGLVRRDLSGLAMSSHIPPEVRVVYLVGAFMAVLRWWIDHNPRVPPTEVNAMFQSLAHGGIETA